MAGAQALGGFTSLTEEESFAVEYWPLELYKLSLRPRPGELQGRVALVTGAAGGIGRAVVDQLAGKGACVVAFDLDDEGAADAVARLSATAESRSAGDVTHEEAVREAFAAAIEAFGGVDIVVSNAGVASSAPIEATALEEWKRIHAILGTGYFLVAREAFSILRAQGQRQVHRRSGFEDRTGRREGRRRLLVPPDRPGRFPSPAASPRVQDLRCCA